jgi:hypothetical protein
LFAAKIFASRDKGFRRKVEDGDKYPTPRKRPYNGRHEIGFETPPRFFVVAAAVAVAQRGGGAVRPARAGSCETPRRVLVKNARNPRKTAGREKVVVS